MADRFSLDSICSTIDEEYSFVVSKIDRCPSVEFERKKQPAVQALRSLNLELLIDVMGISKDSPAMIKMNPI